MGGWKMSKGSKYLSRVPDSASEPNLAIIAQDPPGGLASRQSNSDPRPEQSSGKQKSQQAALSSPNTSRTGRFFDKIKLRFRTSSPTARGNVTAVSSADHASPGDHGPSSSDPQGSPLITISAPIVHPQCEPITTEHPTPPDSALHIPTSTCHALALAKTDVHAAILPQKSTKCPNAIEPSPFSSLVWAKALEIAVKKLHDNNLPPLDLTNLTSQSAEENIEAIIEALNTLQEDDKKKRWSYTWHGKEVIVMERLGKILKSMEKCSKVVDTAIQSCPKVSALVWAGILGIMQVCI